MNSTFSPYLIFQVFLNWHTNVCPFLLFVVAIKFDEIKFFLLELRRQKDQIKDIETEVDNIDNTLKRAEKLVANFTRRMVTKKIIKFLFIFTYYRISLNKKKDLKVSFILFSLNKLKLFVKTDFYWILLNLIYFFIFKGCFHYYFIVVVFIHFRQKRLFWYYNFCMQICCFIYPLLFLIDAFNIIKWFLYLYLYFKYEMKATDKLIQGFATVNIVVMLSLVLYIAISGKSLSGLNIPNLVF